ncbi:hypothetical protein ACHQM5_013679 [Ranunculus cassubicifolius]
MNRSFRAQDSQMQATSLPRRRNNSSNNLGSMMKEKEEELALFLEMRKREKERNNLLLQNSEEFESPLGSKPGSSPIFKIVQSAPTRKTPTDDFLNSENDKNDYDWLLTPPGTPLFPSLEMDSQKTVMSQLGTPNPRPTALKSRLANAAEPVARNNYASRQPISPGLYSSSNGTTRRPSSSGGSGSAASSRPSTPTGRPTLTSTATSRPTSTSTATSRPTLTSTTRASRPSTPTRSTIPSSTKTTAPPPPRSRTPARSSTPTSRPSLQASKPSTITAAKSSIPSSRSTIPSVSRSTSRASTPTRRPSTPSTTSAPVRSSSVTRSAPMLSTTTKNPVPSRGSSPTVKSRPSLWKPSEMPGFSLDAPPNLRTTMPDRPLSATRGRPGGPSSARSASVEPSPAGRPRRTSCSPSRGRAPNHISGSSVPAVSRARINNSDNVSPVQMGNKMVERVVNMRKLAPPRHEDPRSNHNSLSGKTSSPESTGFGRNLSKKSLDMALRHMDIRRSVPGSLRPLMTNIPASSMYSVRSGPVRSRPVSVSDSPLATSSNASSERSVNNIPGFGYASEVDDADLGVSLDGGDP